MFGIEWILLLPRDGLGWCIYEDAVVEGVVVVLGCRYWL